MACTNFPLVTLGAIAGGELYTLAEFKSRLRLKDHAVRQARRNGLRVRKIGRVAYVLGQDVIDFLKANDRQEEVFHAR